MPLHAAAARLAAGVMTLAVWASTPALPGDAADGRLRATLDGHDVAPGLAASIVVRQDLGHLDAATILVRVPARPTPAVVARWVGRFPAGASIEVTVEPGPTGPPVSVFKGEIVAVAPAFKVGGDARVVIRALDRLHRLTRERKTRTFDGVSDADIVQAIAAEHDLAAEAGSEALIEYDHVYQHNQTDLEFLRVRAARIGYEVFVDDTTLVFDRAPEQPAQTLSPVPTGADGTRLLQVFHPRLASRRQVRRVIVRGPVVGQAEVPVIRLDGSSDPPPLVGRTLDCTPEIPATTAEDASRLALATLAALTAHDVAAEGATPGHPDLRARTPVVVEGVGAAFDGRYYVVATSHEYTSHQLGGDGGYKTQFRLQRADRAWFWLPEVGDDVLVAFEHGDLQRPVVVGPLWESDDPPESDGDDPTCEERG